MTKHNVYTNIYTKIVLTEKASQVFTVRIIPNPNSKRIPGWYADKAYEVFKVTNDKSCYVSIFDTEDFYALAENVQEGIVKSYISKEHCETL